MNGHTTADNFLTGAYIKSDGSGQTISLDTFASQFLGKQTRYPSLVLSTDEGVGEVGRRNTVSTTDKGRTIPPLVSTVKLYKHLFDRVPASARQTLQRKRVYWTRYWKTRIRSVIDWAVETSRSSKSTWPRFETLRKRRFEPKSG